MWRSPQAISLTGMLYSLNFPARGERSHGVYGRRDTTQDFRATPRGNNELSDCTFATARLMRGPHPQEQIRPYAKSRSAGICPMLFPTGQLNINEARSNASRYFSAGV